MKKIKIIIIILAVALFLYYALAYVPSETVNVTIVDNFEDSELYELQIWERLGIYRSMEISSQWHLDGYELEVSAYWYEGGQLIETYKPGTLHDMDVWDKLELLIERDNSLGYRISGRNAASTSTNWFGHIDSNSYGMEIVREKFNLKKDDEVVFAVHQESSNGRFLNFKSLQFEEVEKEVKDTEFVVLYTVKLRNMKAD